MSDQAPDTRAGLICERIFARIEDMRAEIAIIRERVDRYGRMLQLRDAAPPTRPEPERPAAPVTAEPPTGAAAEAAPEARDALPAGFQAEAAEQLRAADGFHALEYGRSGPFRWTGPGHDARFVAFLDRTSRLRAVVTLHNIGDSQNEHALQLIVDGQAYPLTREAGTNAFHAGPIRARAGGGATKISLRVPYLTPPGASGGFDTRTLGVAFQKLVLEPA